MFSSNLESRILREAQTRGLVQGEGADEEVSGAPQAFAEGTSLWGKQLASLLKTGRVSEALLNSLAWEAIGGEAGSWADPLFQGPAPIGSLPGLGDRYRDLVLLGEGATAKVFKAMDTLLQRHVALKVLKDEAGPTLAEARAQAQLEHPNVCRIYEVGQGFIVMQLVEGPTLARLASSLSQTQKIKLIRDIALGVHAAHQRDLIHLDLKLNNILVQEAEDGSLLAMVGDFGMMRTQSSETTGGCPLGTPPYTSPEQLAGDPSRLGPRTDVYSLGVMLYVLLAGVIPFQAQDFQGLLECMAKESPVPLRQRLPGVAKDLAALVHRCMEKAPGARYASAQELAEELDRFLASEPLKAMGRSWWYRMSKWSRRNRRMAWVVGLGLTALLVSSGLGIQYSRYVYQRAEWDHHFQKLVEETRKRVDHSYRLPAHDIEPELGQVRGILKAIEGEMSGQGRAVQGPGHLALGQMLLLLDPNDRMAGVHFQKAWDLGFRTEGARTWLAYTLIGSFRGVLYASWAAQDGETAENMRGVARQRYFEPARRMLQGRGNPDQARLAHMAEQLEVWAQEDHATDRALAVARTYRSRFPDDLDGLLEEADALNNKAARLWWTSIKASQTWPPSSGKEVGLLRDEAWRLLQEALLIAPSHPGIYLRLARACQEQVRYPTEPILDRGAHLEQVQDWLRRGRRVSAKDLSLTSTLSMFLGSDGLRSRLSRGQSPEPIGRELLGLLQQAWADKDERLVNIGFQGMNNYIRTCGWSGHSFLGLADEACRFMDSHPLPGAGFTKMSDSFIGFSLTVGKSALESGGEPAIFMQPILRQEDPGPTVNAGWSAFEARLLQAEYLGLRGGDAAPLLRDAEQRLLRYRDTALGTQFDLQLRLLQAQYLGGSEAWAELEACLNRLKTKQEGPFAPGADLLAKARICLARYLLDQARDAGPLLGITREALDAEMANRRSNKLVLADRLAEFCLLEAKSGGNASATLRRGLQETEPILQATQYGEDYAASRTFGPKSSLGTTFIFNAPSPCVGRTHLIRGELLLALAQTDRPASRRWAHRAQQSFLEALRYNVNLKRILAPLQDEARRLTSQGEPDQAQIPVPDQWKSKLQ